MLRLHWAARPAAAGRRSPLHGKRLGWTHSEPISPCTDMQATATESAMRAPHVLEQLHVMGSAQLGMQLQVPASAERRLAQVVALAEYRAQLFEYLRSRMTAIAPNLTARLVPARGQ